MAATHRFAALLAVKESNQPERLGAITPRHKRLAGSLGPSSRSCRIASPEALLALQASFGSAG